jgi:hypothetical protein
VLEELGFCYRDILIGLVYMGFWCRKEIILMGISWSFLSMEAKGGEVL